MTSAWGVRRGWARMVYPAMLIMTLWRGRRVCTKRLIRSIGGRAVDGVHAFGGQGSAGLVECPDMPATVLVT